MREEKHPVRVLCVFSTLDRGGAESMCMNLYRNIDREKVQFDFVKHTPERGAFEDEILSLGGRIYTAPRLKGYNFGSYLAWWNRHFKYHNEHHVVHGHFFTISPLYFYVAHKNNRVTVGHVHASRINGKIKNLLVSLIEKNADYCLACSKESGNWVYPHRKFSVLKNALDTQLFSYNPEVRKEQREALGLDNDCLVLGTVANFSAVKNPLGLLDIFKYIHDGNASAKLLWVGDGSLRNDIEQRIKDYSLNDSVILLGKRNDVPQLLQAMDYFLLPSLSEGLPVSAIEAQAAGLPCFISDTVTKEVDITGLCTFLPNGEEKKWSESILANTVIRTDTSERIRKAGYDIKDTANRIENFYLQINNKRR